MMRKYITLWIFILMSLPIFTFAQTKEPTAEETTTKIVDELETRLKLNTTQKSVIRTFVFNQARQQMELMQQAKKEGYSNEIGDKMYKIQNEANANIKLILKGEQLPEFERFLEDRSNNKAIKKKKSKKNEEQEKVVGIEGLKEQ